MFRVMDLREGRTELSEGTERVARPPEGVVRWIDLRGQDAEQLFRRLCDLDGRRHDPCLLDTFVAAVDHANGAPARPWWYYSRQRKASADSRQ